MNQTTRAALTRPPGWLMVAAFVSSFDRFVVSPILVLVAAGFGASLVEAVGIAGGYYLAYGLCQPVWGILSDRFGRVRLMRCVLVAGAVTGLVSAVAPSLGVLVVARVLTGAFYGAIVPTTLSYVGDTVDDAHRQRALSDLMAFMAVGTAAATAAGGVLAELVGWRAVFAIPATAAAVTAVGLRGLAEPGQAGGRPMSATLRAALANRWVYVVGLLAFVEGGLVLGILTLLAPALQSQGLDAARAGLATAAYGVSVLVSSRALRRLTRHLPRWGLMTVGGLALTLGYAIVAAYLSVATVVAAALLLGVTWAFLHSSLQTWATSLVPAARGTVVALFAACLFVGSSLGASAAGPLAEHDRWQLLFGISAGCALVLTIAAVLAYRRYVARVPARR